MFGSSMFQPNLLFKSHFLMGMLFLLLSSPQYFWEGQTGANFPSSTNLRVLVVFNMLSVVFGALTVKCLVYYNKRTLVGTLSVLTFICNMISISMATSLQPEKKVTLTWQFGFQWVSFCLFFISAMIHWFFDNEDDCNECEYVC